MAGWSFGLIFVRVGALLAAITLGWQAAQAEAHSEPGERARAVCSSCHGADGHSVAPEIPNLAGQSASYLSSQLVAFKSGKRKNAVMAPMAMPLSDEDIRSVASFYEAQPRYVGSADPKHVSRGEQIYRGGIRESGLPACMACHGPDGAGNPAAAYPAISGQNADYTVKQVAAYKSGERSGERAEVMKTIAMRLSDADAEAVAGYLQGLH